MLWRMGINFCRDYPRRATSQPDEQQLPRFEVGVRLRTLKLRMVVHVFGNGISQHEVIVKLIVHFDSFGLLQVFYMDRAFGLRVKRFKPHVKILKVLAYANFKYCFFGAPVDKARL